MFQYNSDHKLTSSNDSVTISGSLTTAPPIIDVFGNPVGVTRQNWMEVPFDSSTYTSFVSETHSGSGSGAVQAAGETRFSTGTSATGSDVVVALDPVRYRSGQEAGIGFTVYFPNGGVANCRQRIGAAVGTSANWNDSVWLGYDDTGANFGIYYYRGGSLIQFTSQTQIEAVVGYALDPTKDQICRILFGLFGQRGWVFEMNTTGGQSDQWATVSSYIGTNTLQGPIFAAEFLIYSKVEVTKTSGATNVQMASSCWAGWTTSGEKRLSDPFSARTLVTPGQVVIAGETTAGGGGYVNVKVNPAGNLSVANASVGTTGAVVPTSSTLVAGTNAGVLTAFAVDSSGRQSVKDIFTGGEILADQSGAGAVLTFTFASAVQLVNVFAKSATGTLQARADPFGGTPSATLGIPCEDGIPMSLPVQASTVKIYAPTGMTVSVWGQRY